MKTIHKEKLKDSIFDRVSNNLVKARIIKNTEELSNIVLPENEFERNIKFYLNQKIVEYLSERYSNIETYQNKDNEVEYSKYFYIFTPEELNKLINSIIEEIE